MHGQDANQARTTLMARNPNDQLQKARDCLNNSNAPGALAIIETVLRKAPFNPDANYLLGLTRLINGNAQSAIAPLEITLRSDPHNGAALDSLGLCYLMQSRFTDAEQVLRRAASIPRAPALVFMRLGLALLHQGKAVEAIPFLQRTVAMAPRDADGHMNLGRALHLAGQAAASHSEFESALALAPDHADTLFNLGVVCLEQNELDTATHWFKQAIARAPAHAQAWVNLGIVQERQPDLDAALASYRKAWEIEPRLPVAGNNLAHVYATLGEHEEARSLYLATLQLAPEFIAAHEGLASVCLALGRVKEAIAHLRLTVEAEPANHGALLALANALFEAGQLDEVEPLARRACELNPAAAEPYAMLATLYGVRGALEQSVAVLESGYERTHNSGLLGMLAFQYRQLCDWNKWERAWATLALLIDTHAALGSPFWLLCEPLTAQQQLRYTQAWAAARFKGIKTLSPRASRQARHERLRIGYLSSDFHEHATAYLIADVLEQHDGGRFEIFAYSYGPEDHSPTRQRLRNACEHFVDIAWDTDDASAARIRDDEIDILVDLKGYTLGDRLTILARRPCDIQVTWLGYPGTTATPYVDAVIADPYLIRADEETAFSERVLRMPHCYQPNDRKRVVAQTLSRHAYGLPDGGFVFCCFNQTYKFTPRVFAAWMRLLKRVPQSVLWLLDGGATAQRNLLQAAFVHGVTAQQLVFAPRRPHSEHLARYRAADLALDTFPYTSHTTMSDALWCGCPAVGLAGDTFASRVSGSLLSASGLDELISGSIADYEQRALQLATDTVLLGQIRAKVSLARDNAPLFDSEQFARDLERLYEGLIVEAEQRRGSQHSYT